MDKNKLDELVESFLQNEYPTKLKEYEKAEQKRFRFLELFPNKSLNALNIDEYVQGKQNKSFCWWIERGLQILGSIQGSTVEKFGIWFDKKTNEYKYSEKFGNSFKEAWTFVRNSLSDLINAGNQMDFKKIENNILSTMFKSKILSIYFPDKYLPIFSIEHVKYFMNILDLKYDENVTFYSNKEKLCIFLKQTKLRDMSLHFFMIFLYYSFPMSNILLKNFKLYLQKISSSSKTGKVNSYINALKRLINILNPNLDVLDIKSILEKYDNFSKNKPPYFSNDDSRCNNSYFKKGFVKAAIKELQNYYKITERYSTDVIFLPKKILYY